MRSSSIIEFGKLPPQAIEQETSVVAAVLIDPSCVDVATEIIITDEVFYKDANRLIWRAIQTLHNDNKAIDALTVANQLKKTDDLERCGGYHYLASITNSIGSSANVQEWCMIAYECYLRRKLIELSSSTIAEAYNDTSDAFELLDGLISDATNALNKTPQGEMPLNEVVKTCINNAYNASKAGNISGIRTGLESLTKKLNGWQKCSLNVIAGRPGMGKTTLALSLLLNQAKDNMPVAFFSLEMSSEQLVSKLISKLTGINHDRFRRGALSFEEWNVIDSVRMQMNSLPIHIDDTASSLNAIRARSKKLIKEKGVECIYIDYLQLITTNVKGAIREQEVANISRSLKLLAKETGVPVIALSQLSRAVESRGGDKRPLLSDLRESGSIEQDCDTVTFIWRPEYYKIPQIEYNGQTLDISSDYRNRGFTEIDIAKNRHGSAGVVASRFVAENSSFVEWDVLAVNDDVDLCF